MTETLGHNNPPEPTPFEKAKERCDELYLEAKNWLDGSAVETEEQAETLGRLLDDLRAAWKTAENARKDEAKVFDDGKAEVQRRYKPVLDQTQRAADAAKACLTKWLSRKEQERQAEARRLREEADRKAQEAAFAAREAARSDDLAVKEDAEQVVADAGAAAAAARQVEKERPNIAGINKAISMRTVYEPSIDDFAKALMHYVATNPDPFDELILKLAGADIRSGKRQIPGIVVIERKTVA
jgi:hypothetical protein